MDQAVTKTENKTTAVAKPCVKDSLSSLLVTMGDGIKRSESQQLAQLRTFPEPELRKHLALVIQGPPRASKKDFAVCLFKLFNHYWTPEFAPDQWNSVLEDFVCDMGECTAAELQEACGLYRMDGESRFRPTPGQLFEGVKWRVDLRRKKERGAKRALELLDSAPPDTTPKKLRTVAEILASKAKEQTV